MLVVKACYALRRFIRTADDDAEGGWEVALARRYYAKLFKEYAIADLSRYKVRSPYSPLACMPNASAPVHAHAHTHTHRRGGGRGENIRGDGGGEREGERERERERELGEPRLLLAPGIG